MTKLLQVQDEQSSDGVELNYFDRQKTNITPQVDFNKINEELIALGIRKPETRELESIDDIIKSIEGMVEDDKEIKSPSKPLIPSFRDDNQPKPIFANALPIDHHRKKLDDENGTLKLKTTTGLRDARVQPLTYKIGSLDGDKIFIMSLSDTLSDKFTKLMNTVDKEFKSSVVTLNNKIIDYYKLLVRRHKYDSTIVPVITNVTNSNNLSKLDYIIDTDFDLKSCPRYDYLQTSSFSNGKPTYLSILLLVLPFISKIVKTRSVETSIDIDASDVDLIKSLKSDNGISESNLDIRPELVSTSTKLNRTRIVSSVDIESVISMVNVFCDFLTVSKTTITYKLIEQFADEMKIIFILLNNYIDSAVSNSAIHSKICRMRHNDDPIFSNAGIYVHSTTISCISTNYYKLDLMSKLDIVKFDRTDYCHDSNNPSKNKTITYFLNKTILDQFEFLITDGVAKIRNKIPYAYYQFPISHIAKAISKLKTVSNLEELAKHQSYINLILQNSHIHNTKVLLNVGGAEYYENRILDIKDHLEEYKNIDLRMSYNDNNIVGDFNQYVESIKSVRIERLDSVTKRDSDIWNKIRTAFQKLPFTMFDFNIKTFGELEDFINNELKQLNVLFFRLDKLADSGGITAPNRQWMSDEQDSRYGLVIYDMVYHSSNDSRIFEPLLQSIGKYIQKSLTVINRDYIDLRTGEVVKKNTKPVLNMDLDNCHVASANNVMDYFNLDSKFLQSYYADKRKVRRELAIKIFNNTYPNSSTELTTLEINKYPCYISFVKRMILIILNGGAISYKQVVESMKDSGVVLGIDNTEITHDTVKKIIKNINHYLHDYIQDMNNLRLAVSQYILSKRIDPSASEVDLTLPNSNVLTIKLEKHSDNSHYVNSDVVRHVTYMMFEYFESSIILPLQYEIKDSMIINMFDGLVFYDNQKFWDRITTINDKHYILSRVIFYDKVYDVKIGISVERFNKLNRLDYVS